jgi:hypothetical protein
MTGWYLMEFKHVSSEAAERLMDLAGRVQGTLITAAIPAFDTSSPDPRGGAKIEVDTADYDTGGVYITWSLSQELTEEISGYLLSKDYSHPRIQYSGNIRIAMRDAIITILQSAGFSAGPAEDDIRALAVRVSE